MCTSVMRVVRLFCAPQGDIYVISHTLETPHDIPHNQQADGQASPLATSKQHRSRAEPAEQS